MTQLFASLIFAAVLGLSFLTSAGEIEESAQETHLKQCLEMCTATTSPGWEVKKCVAKCVKTYGDSASALYKVVEILSKCETYEEDCERDDDDPWGGL